MKRFLLFLVVALVSVSTGFAKDEIIEALKRDAQIYEDSRVKADHERHFAYTHKRVVDFLGGKEYLILKSKTSDSDGHRYIEARIGAPTRPRKVGPWLISTMPEHLVAKVAGGRYISDAVILGISEDLGKSWAFVPQMPPGALPKIYPELAGQVELPEAKPMVFQKDEGSPAAR